MVVSVGYQRHLRRADSLNQGHEAWVVCHSLAPGSLRFSKRIPFNIQFRRGSRARLGERRIAQSNAVVATNMSLVWAWVNGDAVCSRLKHRGGEFAGVRVTGISGVPDQSDFVEVNTKLYHGATSQRQALSLGYSPSNALHRQDDDGLDRYILKNGRPSRRHGWRLTRIGERNDVHHLHAIQYLSKYGVSVFPG